MFWQRLQIYGEYKRFWPTLLMCGKIKNRAPGVIVSVRAKRILVHKTHTQARSHKLNPRSHPPKELLSYSQNIPILYQ
jgi:hypothetical protein